MAVLFFPMLYWEGASSERGRPRRWRSLRCGVRSTCPRRRRRSRRRAAKADKALSWGGFDDQVKATQVGRAGHSLTPRKHLEL